MKKIRLKKIWAVKIYKIKKENNFLPNPVECRVAFVAKVTSKLPSALEKNIHYSKPVLQVTCL